MKTDNKARAIHLLNLRGQDRVEETVGRLNLDACAAHGMSVRTVSAKVVANLGWNNVKAMHAVLAGDAQSIHQTTLGY